jgi:HlyD family secretion protein
MKFPAIDKKVYWAGAAVAIVAVGGFAFFNRGGAKTGKYEWEMATVEKGDVSRIVTASGTVQPLNVVDVGSQVSGRIVEVLVDYNSRVRTGQVLARIDPETFQSQVNSARARVLQSEAQVASSQAQIDRSTVNLENTERNYTRNQALFAQQAISQSAMETSDRDVRVARVQLETDRVALRSSQAGLAQSRASLSDAETNLARTYIRSPIDGVVINRAVNVGQTVQSSMQVANLFKIAEDLSQVQIEAAVVEGDISGISDGDPVSFSVDAQQGRRFNGTVYQVRQQGTEQANVVTYTVVIRARNPDNTLLPGMTANVDITADRATNVLRIANDATRFQPPRELLEALNERDRANGQGGPGGQGGGQGGQGGQRREGGQGGGQGAPGGGGAQTAGFGGPGGGGGGFGGPGGGGQRGQGGGFGGGRGGPGGISPDMLKEMGVPDDKVHAIQTEMNAEMERMRASMPRPQQQGGGNPMAAGAGGGFGPPQDMVMRQQMQARMAQMQTAMEGILRRNLTEEQYAAFTAKRAEQAAQKRVVVYTVNPAGELQRHPLMIGISDGSYAQVIRGANEGDQFILRLKQPAQPGQQQQR